jgi:ribosomal protein S27AE
MSTQSKPCRNCGETDFFTGDAARTVAISLTTLPPKFHLRVCGNCGLVDWFLPDKVL